MFRLTGRILWEPWWIVQHRTTTGPLPGTYNDYTMNVHISHLIDVLQASNTVQQVPSNTSYSQAVYYCVLYGLFSGELCCTVVYSYVLFDITVFFCVLLFTPFYCSLWTLGKFKKKFLLKYPCFRHSDIPPPDKRSKKKKGKGESDIELSARASLRSIFFISNII